MTRRRRRTTLSGVAPGFMPSVLARGFALLGLDKRFRQLVGNALPLVRLSLRLLWWASPSLTLGIAAVLVLQSLMAPLQLVLSRATIDRAALDLGVARAAPSSAHIGFGPAVTAFPLGAWLALTAAALAVGYLLQPVSATLQAMVGDQVTGIVTERMILAANRWPGLARFEDPEFADDLDRAAKHVGPGLMLLLVGAQLTVALVTGVTAVLLLARLHPLLPAALVAAMLPQAARERAYHLSVGRILHNQTADAHRLDYSRNVLLTPDAGKDVRLFGLSPFFRRRYAAIFSRIVGEIEALRRPLAGWETAAGGLSGAAAGAVYFLVVWRIAHGALTLGDLALYGGAATLL